MSQSSSPPALPKSLFLVADAAFLGAAWLIAEYSAHPLREASLAAIVVCVLAAAFVGAFPFVLDYTRRQESALDERQNSLAALARTVGTSAEQISIAVSGLNEITSKLELTRDDDREELERELASLRSSESERLAATAEKISRAASDWAKAESTGLRHVVAAKTFIAELEQKIATLKEAAAAMAAAEPAPASAPAEPPPVATLSDSSDPEAAKAAPRKRPVRKAPLEEPTLGLDAASLEPTEATVTPAAPSPDGATRLTVTAYIGIGNRLFIRGEGPGLSWDEGVPLQFVSIGKWRWETTTAAQAVQFKLYKNDRDECPLPVDRLEAGHQQELTAAN
ncbi:MAG TPA: hypothetical protein VGL42_17905 [Opitutaceae bacterium]|jgi:hypothetical protein